MNWFKALIFRLLKIKPATEREIIIEEPLTFNANVLKNQIWYRGDPLEIEQFFKQAAAGVGDNARFWAAAPFRKIRKIHSGIVGIVVDRYADIVMSDLNQIDFNEEGENKPLLELWEEIANSDNGIDFEELMNEAIRTTLSMGDGAFKISVDENEIYPVVEFFPANQVDFVRKNRRIAEIKFYTTYKKENTEYRLEEVYGRGYIDYHLYDEYGKEVYIDTIPETANLEYTTFNGDFIMGVPLMFFHSIKWEGRGKALFDGKSDDLDALDEILSQWMDAVRKGRINKYVPEDMIPRDPETGRIIKPNDFDNDYIAIGTTRVEGDNNKIEVSQPNILYQSYVESYSNFLDIVLQGIISPATLGIDLKKTDNATAQREKEKITLHTRNKIVSVLYSVIPELVSKIMMVNDLMIKETANDYEVQVTFGEYAAPDFDSVITTVGKAKLQGLMSIETAIDELYGDSKDDEWKQEEIERLKAEQGLIEMEEPAINTDGIEIVEEGE